MANKFVLGFFITTGMLSLAACTSVQTASERQTYFENASTAKLAWQPLPDAPTSFQACMWGSQDYPCQLPSQLSVSQQISYKATKPEPLRLPVHKKVRHTKSKMHTQSLPLCQPVPITNESVASVSASSPSSNKTTI